MMPLHHEKQRSTLCGSSRTMETRWTTPHMHSVITLLLVCLLKSPELVVEASWNTHMNRVKLCLRSPPSQSTQSKLHNISGGAASSWFEGWTGKNRDNTVEESPSNTRKKSIGSSDSSNNNILRRRRQRHSSTNSSSNDNPVLYRYFGGVRMQHHRSDVVPFILLGPSVDDWKATGHLLSLKGFHVMACERVANNSQHQDGQTLVLAILNALKWERAVLVGCGGEDAILAIQAALHLAPERVAGVVLCGDRKAAEAFVQRYPQQPQQPQQHPSQNDSSLNGLDFFLDSMLNCPNAIIWDGDVPIVKPKLWRKTPPSSALSLSSASQRNMIVGGGLDPHVRLPEQFAWALTRFVEEKVRERQIEDVKSENDSVKGETALLEWKAKDGKQALTEGKRQQQQQQQQQKHGEQKHWWSIFGLSPLFSSGTSSLVAGRIVATTLFYLCAFQVSIFQFHNAKHGFGLVPLMQCWKNQLGQNMVLRQVGFLFRGLMPIIVTSKSRHGTKNTDISNDDLEEPVVSSQESTQSESVNDDESMQTATHQSIREDADKDRKTEDYLGESFISEKSENMIQENNVPDTNGGDDASLFLEDPSSSSSPGSLEILREHEMEEDSMIIDAPKDDLHSHPNNDNTREKELQSESMTSNIPSEETELTHRIHCTPTEKELNNNS